MFCKKHKLEMSKTAEYGGHKLSLMWCLLCRQAVVGYNNQSDSPIKLVEIEGTHTLCFWLLSIEVELRLSADYHFQMFLRICNRVARQFFLDLAKLKALELELGL